MVLTGLRPLSLSVAIPPCHNRFALLVLAHTICYALFKCQDLKNDVRELRSEWQVSGPMAEGISPLEAVERLRRFKEKIQLLQRKVEDVSWSNASFSKSILD